MKVKTSVTLSRTAVRALDRLAGRNGNRSAVAERAILEYARLRARADRNDRDRELIDGHADELNEELSEVLAFQAEP
jgi:predicted transcriptional regulator